MWMAMYQHSPEDVAVGFGNTPEEAGVSLVAEYPNGAGRELDTIEVGVGFGFSSIAEVKHGTIIVGCRTKSSSTT